MTSSFEGKLDMNRSLTIVVAFSVGLTCAAAAKSAAPVQVPLPRNNPLKNNEQENQQNSKSAADLFSEKKLPSFGRPMAIGYYPRGCLQGGVEFPTTRPAVPGGDGCDKSLDHWFADWILRLKIPEFGGSSRGLKLKDLSAGVRCCAQCPGGSG